MIEDVLNFRLGVLIGSFLVIAFIVRFLDYFLLYVPVMIIGNPEKAGLLPFTFFNYLPKMLYAGVKVTFIAAILNGALLLQGDDLEEGQTIFSSLFKIALLSEGAFLLHVFLRLVYFVLVNENYTLSEYSEFNPLSIGSLSSGAHPIFKDLLNNLNVFKSFQILILTLGVRKIMNGSFIKSAGIVIASYGALYFGWEIMWGYFYL